jgi:hypothetical protein
MPFKDVLVVIDPVRVPVTSLYPKVPFSHPVFGPFLDPAFYDFHDIDAQPPEEEGHGTFVALAACIGYDVDPFGVHTKAFQSVRQGENSFHGALIKV